MSRSIWRVAAIFSWVLASTLVPAVAAPVITVSTQTATELKGSLRNPSISFEARRVSEQLVHIEVFAGPATQVHAEIDYGSKDVKVRSFSRKDGTPRAISISDLARFQQLLKSAPGKIDSSTRLGDAVISLLNMLSSAPPGRVLEIGSSSQDTPQASTSICGQVGGSGVGTYTLDGTTFNTPVTVGPVCYVPPALGRCGAAGGPDTGIGSVQRFTQECLNHDQCCVATGTRYERRMGFRVNVCGNSDGQCEPEFKAATSGFFFARDCGTTAGNWTDGFGYTYTFTGGDSSGSATPFTGTANTLSCGIWTAAGTRTGTGISFTATNPAGASGSCAASYTYVGTYSGCNAAAGTWSNSSGLEGSWSWTRDGAAKLYSAPGTAGVKGPAER